MFLLSLRVIMTALTGVVVAPALRRGVEPRRRPGPASAAVSDTGLGKVAGNAGLGVGVEKGRCLEGISFTIALIR